MERTVCDVCNRRFLSEWTLRNHKVFHNKKLVRVADINNKICGICQKRLSLSNFRFLANRSYNSYCRPCENKKNLEYRKKRPELSRRLFKTAYFRWKEKTVGSSCVICGENRTLDVCHIVARNGRNMSRLDPRDNLLGLCPTHHRLFDEEKLNSDEYGKIKVQVEGARKKYV